MKLIIHTDGGARGNPGPAAIGVVIEKVDTKKEILREFGKTIGETTNNVAEYTAVVEALKELISQNLKEHTEIQFYLDSTLVVNQINGTFKVKDAKLRELLLYVRSLEQDLDAVISYFVIPREENRRADFLVNKALDNY